MNGNLRNNIMIELKDVVYPSYETTIDVVDDEYGGAHEYYVRHSKGFNNGRVEYVDKETCLQFVTKLEDGTIVDGLQSEQLAIILKDRAIKLGAKYPNEWTDKMVAGLDMFLEACKDRVASRMNRGVMGKLKK